MIHAVTLQQKSEQSSKYTGSNQRRQRASSTGALRRRLFGRRARGLGLADNGASDASIVAALVIREDRSGAIEDDICALSKSKVSNP